MAISFGVASATTTTSGSGLGGNGTLTTPLPTNWSVGQLAILLIYLDQGAATTPANWNLISGAPWGTSTPKLYAFWKFLAAGEANPASTISGAGATSASVGAISTYNYVDPTTPIDAVGTGNQGTGSAVSNTGVTTATNNAWVLGLVGRGDNEVIGTYTYGGSSTGITEQFDTGDAAGDDAEVSLCDLLKATAGASGAFAATTSITDPWVSVSIALKPGTLRAEDSDPPKTLRVAGSGITPSLAFWAVSVFLGTDGAVKQSTIDESPYLPPPTQVQVNQQYRIDDPADLPVFIAPQIIDDSDGWWLGPRPVVWTPPVKAILDTDDIVAKIAEEDYWLIPRPVPQVLPPVQAITADTDGVPQVVDEYYTVVIPPPVQWLPPVQALVDTQDIVSQPLIDDSDGWWKQDQANPWIITQWIGGEDVVQQTIDDSDGWWLGPRPVQWFPPVQAIIDTVEPVPTVIDELFWQPPAPWVQLTQQLWIDDSLESQPRLIDTDFYIPPLPWIQQTQQLWIDDSTESQVRYVDEDYWNVIVIPPVPTVVRVWYGDEEAVTPPFAFDDSYWLPSLPSDPRTVTQWIGGEDVTQQAVPVTLVEDTEWKAPIVWTTQPPQATTDDEIIGSYFSWLDGSQTWQAPIVWPPTTAAPFTDDEIIGSYFAWLDGDQTWRAPIVWPDTTAQPVTDTDVLGHAEWLDADHPWLPPILPATQVVRVWYGDDEVVRPLNVNEDYWINWVAPVVWTSQPAIIDDSSLWVPAAAPLPVDEQYTVVYPVDNRPVSNAEWVGRKWITEEIWPHTWDDCQGYIPTETYREICNKWYRLWLPDEWPRPRAVFEDYWINPLTQRVWSGWPTSYHVHSRMPMWIIVSSNTDIVMDWTTVISSPCYHVDVHAVVDPLATGMVESDPTVDMSAVSDPAVTGVEETDPGISISAEDDPFTIITDCTC